MSLRVLTPILLVLTVAGCGDGTGDPIHYIVPTGFEGVIQIVADGSDSGGYRHVNGRNEYIIPADGVLHVRSAQPFARWHKDSASEASGVPIPVRYPIGASEPRIFYGFGSSISNGGPPVHWYAVGTPEFLLRVQTWFNSGSIGQPHPTPATRPFTQLTSPPPPQSRLHADPRGAAVERAV